ncbi:MAG: ABC-2 type transport system ATP-binding protein [Planctomycetota bacterium]|jgi:ABC-2 type transport system ATP-binding protein
MIEVAHLHRRYGNLAAVDDLSFQLEKGEVVGFLGPNGAGKTTTMRILSGYLPATKAERLIVAGFDVLRQSMEVRKHIGYLPESVPLYRELRVEEMLRFHGRLHGMSKADLKKAVPAVLERVGVLDRSRQLVGQLSRGLKQRVGLAVALLPNPDVLILDEPTSGLDPLQRRAVRDLIHELAQEHTVLVSSHILAEIELICPRVIVLDRGRLLADGTQAELLSQLANPLAVHLEAMCGDAEEAQRLLKSLPDVTDVLIGERTGIHQAFEIRGGGDLREDVGALASMRGWALRELSMKQQTLEEVFASLILGGEPLEAPVKTAPAGGVAESTAAPLVSLAVSDGLQIAMTAPTLPMAAAAPDSGTAKRIYSLNPFDRGDVRDLSKPVTQEPGPEEASAIEIETPEPGSDCKTGDGGEAS